MPAAFAQVALVVLGAPGEDVVERQAQGVRHLAGHELHVVGAAPRESLGRARHEAHGAHARERLGAEALPRGLDHTRRQIGREPALLGVLVGAHHAVVGPLEHRIAAMGVEVGDDLQKCLARRRVGAVLRPRVVLAGQAGAALGAHEGAERGAAARAGPALVYLVHEVAAARAQQLAHGVAAHAARRPEHLRQRVSTAPKGSTAQGHGGRSHPCRRLRETTGTACAPGANAFGIASSPRIAPPLHAPHASSPDTTLPQARRQKRMNSMELQAHVTET